MLSRLAVVDLEAAVPLQVLVVHWHYPDYFPHGYIPHFQDTEAHSRSLYDLVGTARLVAEVAASSVVAIVHPLEVLDRSDVWLEPGSGPPPVVVYARDPALFYRKHQNAYCGFVVVFEVPGEVSHFLLADSLVVLALEGVVVRPIVVLLFVDVDGIDDPAKMVLVVRYNPRCYIVDSRCYSVVLVAYNLVEELLDTAVLADKLVVVADTGSCQNFGIHSDGCYTALDSLNSLLAGRRPLPYQYLVAAVEFVQLPGLSQTGAFPRSAGVLVLEAGSTVPGRQEPSHTQGKLLVLVLVDQQVRSVGSTALQPASKSVSPCVVVDHPLLLPCVQVR